MTGHSAGKQGDEHEAAKSLAEPGYLNRYLLRSNHFKTLLYTMIAPAKACLRKYTMPEHCGKHNATVLEDLNSNSEFNRLSNQLHDRAVASKFYEPPTMDGNAIIHGVDIECGKRLAVRFELSFLSPQYFVTPAIFAVEFDDNNTNESGTAIYGCGTLNNHGEFCTAKSRNCILPDAGFGWAVLVSCRFGDMGLKDWAKNQTSGR